MYRDVHAGIQIQEFSYHDEPSMSKRELDYRD